MSHQAKDVLLAHEIKPSYQRLLIYNRLNQPYQHLTVDQIYKDLAPQVPTLSKTTVYNTLKLMCEKGLAREIPTDYHESRFEIVSEPHGHFKCQKCGDILDFPIEPIKTQIPALANCTIKEIHTTITGLCPRCQAH